MGTSADYFTKMLIKAEKPMHGVAALLNGALALGACDNGEKVTKLHQCAALLCLKAKCYSHARKLLDAPITGMFKSGMNPIDIVTYNYYRGMLYCGLNDFERAADAFKNVIMYPSKCVHEVHLDAFKKLAIVTLMNTGREFTFPEDAPSELTQFIQQ
jgi:hypothetical protein